MLRFDALPKPVNDLLLSLAPRAELRGFALGGGTSLALRFGHRLSVDLDFFATEAFSPNDLLTSLELEVATVVTQATNSVTVDAGGVKLDFLRHAYPLLEPVECIDGIALLSLPDLAAMKFNAIANRGSKKDFFDFVGLSAHFSMQEMIGFFTLKYPSSDAFTVIRSLAWFEDAEEEPDPVSLIGLEWGEVKSLAREAVASL
ncbi:MAG: nucleotidyl transferase AbiEii/AbiGii toxin family protein [Akkermansiaceae bacterium]